MVDSTKLAGWLGTFGVTFHAVSTVHRRLASVGWLMLGSSLGVGLHGAGAQSGRLLGRVTDSSGTPLVGVQVSVQRADLQTTTSDSGWFRFTMPAGRHLLAFRRMGFAPAFDSVTVAEGAALDRTFFLRSQPVTLDPVTVARPLSAHMRRFEERRHTEQGTFITVTEIQAMEGRPLRSVLSKRLAGVTFVHYRGALYVASSRGMTALDRRMRIPAVAGDPRSPVACWPQVYLDGTRVYAPTGTLDAINLNDFQTRDFEAIEYYAGAASTPPEFGTMFSSCGTLVLWTRLP